MARKKLAQRKRVEAAVKAVKSLEKKRESFSDAKREQVMEFKKMRTEHEKFRKDHADILSIGFSAPLSSGTCECTCSGCASANDGSKVALEKRMLGGHGPLKNVPEMKAELNAHGITTNIMRKDGLKTELQKLIEKKAFFLTKVAVQLQPPVEAPASPPSQAANVTMTKDKSLSPGHFSSPITPNAKRESREQRTLRKGLDLDVADVEDLPWWREKIADDPAMAKVYGLAFRAVTAKVLTYEAYLSFMTAREVTKKLSQHEWDKVLLISFVLAQRLLDEYLDEGADVARSVHEALRAHTHGEWTEYWPLGHHENRVRALQVDTAWAVQGYTSAHGVTHIQDCATQLILAVCQLTKNSDTDGVIFC
jgi:hypothetical protein